MLNPLLCIDTLGGNEKAKMGLFPCADNMEDPQPAQFFTLRHFRDIELKGTMFCFDQDQSGTLLTGICHHSQGNQYFRYNLATKQIHHGSNHRNECLDMDETKFDAGSIFISHCDSNSLSQKWKWAITNETALMSWIVNGAEIIDKKEIEALSES